MAQGIDRVTGIVADVGLSSYQLAAAERGFAFAEDGPLDMRMGGDGPTAADLLATLDETELTGLLRDYGDEPQARRIARLVVARRDVAPITRTRQLRSIVQAAKRGAQGPRDPATQTFQALRIAVNDELGELERLLEAAATVLTPGGRLVVVSFHSGEDRIVKRLVERPGGQVRGARGTCRRSSCRRGASSGRSAASSDRASPRSSAIPAPARRA